MQQKGSVSKKQYYHLLSKTIFAHRKGILLNYLNYISTTPELFVTYFRNRFRNVQWYNTSESVL